MCFRAIRCGNETPMILLYILSLQDHQGDGEVNRQVVRLSEMKYIEMRSNIAMIKDIDITVVCWTAFHMLSG